MRGVRSLPAAAVGLVVLLFMPVIQGQEGWKVTYSPTKICALKGSIVEINCTYRYSPTKRPVTTVDKTVWFSRENYHGPVDLSTDSQYLGRVQSYCENNICTLRITDVRESDSAEYKFRFITNQPDGRFTGSPGVTLSVTGLQVIIPGHQSYGKTEIQCRSSRCLPDQTSYIWYKNGQKLHGETSSSYLEDIYTRYSSYICSLKGHEDFHSPSACRNRQDCNRVTYNQRSICAPKGSSVDISCTYYSLYDVLSKFWFSPQCSHQWQSPSQPQDLSKDTKFKGRIQVLEPVTGRSTLTIRDLRESDSAEYQFKFKTRWYEWGNSLPGTTLTVTVLHVKATRVIVHQSYTEAELECHNSCISASGLSYIWFKNGQKLKEEQSFSYKGQFYPGDTISCALKEHETHHSPLLYALKVPSVSVNPSAEVMENSSVTLTCSTDANPAANYTWYKKYRDLDPQPLSKESKFVFRSIKSSDSGEYYCTAKNELGKRTSEYISVNVRYPPRLLSVSVSPSGEIVEGSSVTLTCSSDANPAANYTWYKRDANSLKASGQIFNITDFRAEDSGNYYCKVQNKVGHHTSTLHLTYAAVNPTTIMNIIRFTLVILMLIPLVLLSQWTSTCWTQSRKKKSLSSTMKPHQPPQTIELDSCSAYENVSNLTRTQTGGTEEHEEMM